MIMYDAMNDLVKSVARKFAADTPHWSQLLFPVPLSVALILFRKVCEKCFFTRFCAARNVRNRRRHRPQPPEVLDSASKAVDDIVTVHFQMLTGVKIKFVNAECTPTQDLSRTWWFSTYYIHSWIFAYDALQQEPWLWDTSLWWYNYPYQVVTTNCWLYYMITIAFSWSVIVSEVTKIPPDVSPTVFSHFCIVVFMSLSWLHGFYRVTIALVFVEDISNILKEAIKLMNCLNFRIIYRMLLPVYIVIWTCTHIVFFQFWILNSVFTKSPETVRDSDLYYIYGPLFMFMLAVRYYTAVLLVRGLFQ